MSSKKEEVTSLDAYFNRVSSSEEQALSGNNAGRRLRRPSAQQEEDEESGIRYFLSEPSVTSEGDQSESVHRDRILSLLSPARDETEEVVRELSPGATSLSSKESLLVGGKMVQLQFTPEHALRNRVRVPYAPELPTLTSKPKPTGIEMKPSPAIGQLSEPLSLSTESYGALREQTGTSDADGTVEEIVVSDAETDKIGNSVASMAHTVDADETLVMTLSETDDDEVRTKDTEATPLDWEQQHSADDEQTPLVSRLNRKRWVPSKIANGHRRTRSGDAAAASLMTGGLDWRGMQRDQLPIPPPHVEEGEEDDEFIDGAQSTPFDERWLKADKGEHVSGVSKISLSNTRWRRSGPSQQYSPREGLELSETGPDLLSPNTFSHLALQPQHQATGPYLASYGTSTSNPRRGRLQSEASADSSLTRESGFSWLSTSEALPAAPGAQFADRGVSKPLQQRESPSESSQYDDEDSESYFSNIEEEEQNIMRTRMPPRGASLQEIPGDEGLLRSRDFTSSIQRGLHGSIVSPFANVGEYGPKASLSSFRVAGMDGVGSGSHPTFVCPRCNTVQREFFTVATAPSQFESPAGYLAVYFGIYVIAALYIFGLEEGWAPLDCVYFAVITLTTAGLGDFVPTSDGAKITCSIFIYFGVACIGLLLGTYLASMMDDKSEKEAKQKRVENCANCSRLNDIRHQRATRAAMSASSREFSGRDFSSRDISGRSRSTVSSQGDKMWFSDRSRDIHSSDIDSAAEGQAGISHARQMSSSLRSISEDNGPSENLRTPSDTESRKREDRREVIHGFGRSPEQLLSPGTKAALGSPMTSQIIRRQSRTRHMSIGHDQQSAFFGSPTDSARKMSEDLASSAAIPEGRPYNPVSSRSTNTEWRAAGESGERSETEDDESFYSASSSLSEEVGAMRAPDKLKAAKYIFLTLKQALMNSILIIVVGGIGFRVIEKMTFVDSFYFTTVLLTTVGYGDIHPVTSAGKLFATVYVLVAGTVLLNNMSLISMIPLELRKRRLERVVLTQFGDQLDDITLRELATGPLVRRLQLSHNPSTPGLDKCTREMFALAMLVRLGKVSERDIRQTFAAFRRLDVDKDGVLSSKSIIAGMMASQRRASQMSIRQSSQTSGRQANQSNAPPPPSYYEHEMREPPLDYWYDSRGVDGHLSAAAREQGFERLSHVQRSVSVSPRFRPDSSERSSLYVSNNQGYDSFPYDVERGPYDDCGYHGGRLSSSLT